MHAGVCVPALRPAGNCPTGENVTAFGQSVGRKPEASPERLRLLLCDKFQ